jgi:hypothetical protein
MSRWDEIFTAATFAEAGEPDAALALLHAHGAVLAAASPACLDEPLLDSALRLCRRIGAGLELLMTDTAGPRVAPPEALARRLAASGVPHHFGTAREPLAAAAVRFAREHPHVRMVVVDGREAPPRPAARSPWNRLTCPLVVAGGNGND